jgi:DNA repair protein RecN (Recombination protein N)
VITLLRISGFALIDELELELGPGLTVITGETGAGKSIVVGALALLRGGRAAADVIRTGRDEARVEAAFDVPADSPVRARLADAGRDVEGELVVRRTISRGERGRVHLGGSLATAGDLGATVGAMVDIVSQHDQQSLTDPESQLAILDAFADAFTASAAAGGAGKASVPAGHHEARREMEVAYNAWREAGAELERFGADLRTRTEREDLLRFQLGELETAKLVDPDEEAALRIERERLRHADKLQTAVSRGEELLYAGEAAVTDRLATVARELAGLVALDPTLGPLVERLRQAQAEVEDVARELGRYGAGTRSDPARLGAIDERLFLLGRLARKHGGTLADAIRRRDEMMRELGDIGSFEEALAARRQAAEAAGTRAGQAAAALTLSRRRAAAGLEERLGRLLGELGLGEARIPVEVTDRDGPGPSGSDKVRFLFAPNPGEPPRPLAKIASGGELSRVMLAVKQALARTDRVRTYVFDEVDTGVGGRTAEIIGRKLKAIAGERQVIAITHLAQIAVFADVHHRVTKAVHAGRTAVTLERLSDRERTREIARMLSGDSPSRQATAHAEELLRRAQAAAP